MSSSSRKHALVIAYYFPPLGLSGVQRVAKLVKYLPENGWDVTVLTVEPGAYFAFDDRLLADLEGPHIRIERTQSVDPTRSVSRRQVPFPDEGKRILFSAVSQFILLPDNKIGWKRFAIKRGREILRERTVDIIYATAPPYTSLLVGHHLAREAGVPLVLDYRDDWLDNPRHSYPTPIHRAISLRLERKVVSSCQAVFAINCAIRNAIASRNPEMADLIEVIPQGYDPADISNSKTESPSDRMVFLYAGMFYDAQKPDAFLRALRMTFDRRVEMTGQTTARFVGLFPEDAKELIVKLDLEHQVEFTGYLDHEASVSQLMSCDVAWMTIGHQDGEEMISTGKLFEYMGTRKPILALVPEGEAKRALKGYDAVFLADPDDEETISQVMEELFDRWKQNRLPVGSESHIQAFDRREQARHISAIFDELSSSGLDSGFIS